MISRTSRLVSVPRHRLGADTRAILRIDIGVRWNHSKMELLCIGRYHSPGDKKSDATGLVGFGSILSRSLRAVSREGVANSRSAQW